MTDDWIDKSVELPPYDGIYETANDKEGLITKMYYDGMGFFKFHEYMPIKFWRHITRIGRRYGKVESSYCNNLHGSCEGCNENKFKCNCGKYTTRSKNTFFYHNKFFNNREHFWSYTKAFASEQTNESDLNILFIDLIENINSEINQKKIKITNGKLKELIDESFDLLMTKIN